MPAGNLKFDYMCCFALYGYRRSRIVHSRDRGGGEKRHGTAADKKSTDTDCGDPNEWPDGKTITVTEGSNVRFNCNPFLSNCPYCAERQYRGTSIAEYAPTYFCEHPCGWGEVKAYTKPTSYGKDERFRVAKRNLGGHNKDGLTVMIVGLKASDGGNLRTSYKGGDGVDGERRRSSGADESFSTEGHDAVSRKQGMALLQKEELKINRSCWLCLQMSHSWRVAPLTVAAVKETRCLIPEQMTRVLMAGAEIEKGRIPQRQPESGCKETRWDGRSEATLPPLRVVHGRGDVCVCQVRPRLKLKAGWSDCRIRINIGNGTADNCTTTINGETDGVHMSFQQAQRFHTCCSLGVWRQSISRSA
ncbi:Sushi domain-containing protein 1 [Labeo rohita]|uniref:Sushi domain-containing protein 1 n=1 Tax=Labeo rohita TaxID=84645 RepID=A0ABQ8MSC3_LABRO|nr:Sushi domain-containing protein 1 [Labeo rohita]